jgi:hypothetical protein
LDLTNSNLHYLERYRIVDVVPASNPYNKLILFHISPANQTKTAHRICYTVFL